MNDIVILPPYVAPEHRQLIEKAESAIDEYNQFLINKIKEQLFEHGWTTDPRLEDIKEAERRFHEDQTRMLLAKQLAILKVLCERPKFMIKALDSDDVIKTAIEEIT